MNANYLRIKFGKDQEIGIDGLVEEMKGEGKILKVKKTPSGEYIHYELSFGQLYDVYSFGHRSADILKYVFGQREKLKP